MTGIIRKKNPGDAWETVPDTGGGGGSQPSASNQETLSGDEMVNPGGLNIALHHVTGGTLLDYSDPTAPTVITAGYYAFSGFCSVFTGGLTGKTAQSGAVLDQLGAGLASDANIDLGASLLSGNFTVPLAIIGYSPAGGALNITCGHNADDPIEFAANMVLLKIA